MLGLFIFIAVLTAGTSGQTARSGQACFAPGQEVTQCDTRLRCDYGRWTPVARCVLGYAYGSGRQCDISNSSNTCRGQYQAAPIVPRVFPRGKRQATQDCNTVFDCPADLTLDFPYPDWRDCGAFFVCRRGRLERGVCRDHGFRYYNPNRYNCENVWSPDNVCLDNQRGYL